MARWRGGWLRAAGLLGGAGAIVLALYLVHPLVSGYRFPIGPDGPVYSWLARWMGQAGLQDGPGGGPGVPALALTVSGFLRTGAIGAVTILGPVLAACCGVAAGGLLATTTRLGAVAVVGAVLLTGSFTAYLAGGWLANVTMVALFLTALASMAVVERSWRAVGAGAALVSAAGLTHGVFLTIGLVILGGVILLHLRDAARAIRAGRSLLDTAAGRMTVAAAAGAAAWLLGSATLAGARIPGDTSQDGFLRRAGLRDLLLDRYRERLLGDLARAGVPLAVGLGLGVAAVDERHPDRRVPRFLAAVCWTWGVVTAVGIVVLAVTGWGPPNRILQFAFFLPLLAAAGLAALVRRGRPAAAAAIVVAAAFVGVSMVGWFRQAPAMTMDDLAAARAAGRAIESAPAGTPLVVVVDTAEPAAGYHVTLAGNVLRMGLPAERIDDVRVAVGTPGDVLSGRPTKTGDPEHDAASAFYLSEARPVLDRATVLVLERFNPEGYPQAVALGEEVGPGVAVLAGRGTPSSLPAPDQGVGPWALVGWCAAAVVLLGAMGAGWARWALPGCGPAPVLGAAPSVGIAVAILGAFVADRFGLHPGAGASLVVVVALGVAGYVAAARAGRRGHEGRLAPA